ncbi:hypothetical protein [Dactylosporangium sp. CA-233914]|uniref:hypothetical protein n=1 Tax=Dactylosporangium sp. CA-233914 TaxID=3239934 RepID=UPI003D8E9C9F
MMESNTLSIKERRKIVRLLVRGAGWHLSGMRTFFDLAVRRWRDAMFADRGMAATSWAP